ncbi:MAG: HRDC domain-containing protein, partial [Parasphingopyxis sp.]
ILKGEEEVALVLHARRRRKRRADASPNPVGDPLFEALREKRKEIAAAAAVPPYVVFHDSTLREMAAAKPDSLAALSRVNGVGTKKLERYGDAFLEVIVAHG